ncbi:uncharacterized protein LOC127878605 [Dreissena polymorpha]|uniref:uncharacterized protein LOC127878605 n=1 Tax=Dreissena polymorpha TaxID=45954 RepID=UPI002264D4F2|nr:uncharacterized protein LOC127878605 [Dreissena polymorpha]
MTLLVNTISQSLGINLNDVDFGFNKNKDDGDIPFWRRSNPTNTQPEVIRPRNILSDVSVNIHHQNQLLGTNRRSEVNIGMDQISDAHKELLIRLRSGPRSFLPTEKTSSILILDRIEQKPNALPRNTGAVLNEAPVNVDWKVDANIPNTRKPFIYVEPKPLERTKVDHESKEMREMQTFFNEFKEVHKERNETGNSVPQPKQIVYQPIVEIVKHVSDDVNIDVLADVLGVIGNQINAIENTKVPVERIVDNVNVQPIVFDMGADSVDVVTGAECRKKPVLDLGDQYFLLPVLGVGYIPYACHGDQVYDHFICGCRKATSGNISKSWFYF